MVAEVAMELQKGTNIRPLWGTAQLFKHPRYMHGAATSTQGRVRLCARGRVCVCVCAYLGVGRKGKTAVGWSAGSHGRVWF
jgi:xylose isomerase